MSRASVAATFFLVGLAFGCTSSDNSGGTTTTCGYACVEGNEPAQRSNLQSGLLASAGNQECEAHVNNVKNETGYSICSQEVLTTSEDLPCDVDGVNPFVIILNQAIEECTPRDPAGPLDPTCVGPYLETWTAGDGEQLPAGCVSCGQETLDDFFSCIAGVPTLDDGTLTPCIATWVTSSTSCNP